MNYLFFQHPFPPELHSRARSPTDVQPLSGQRSHLPHLQHLSPAPELLRGDGAGAETPQNPAEPLPRRPRGETPKRRARGMERMEQLP